MHVLLVRKHVHIKRKHVTLSMARVLIRHRITTWFLHSHVVVTQSLYGAGKD